MTGILLSAAATIVQMTWRWYGLAAYPKCVMRTASFGHDPIWQSPPAERLAEVTQGAPLLNHHCVASLK